MVSNIRPGTKSKVKTKIINPAGRLSDSAIRTLYLNVKKYQEAGGLHSLTPRVSKVLLNETLPSLLLEVMQLRGIEPPD